MMLFVTVSLFVVALLFLQCAELVESGELKTIKTKGFKILNLIHNGPDSISFDAPIDNNTPWTIGDDVYFILPLSSDETISVIGKVTYTKNFETSNQQENIYIHGTIPLVAGISNEAGTFSMSFFIDTMSANVQFPGDIQFELRPSTIQQNNYGIAKSYIMSKVDMMEKYYSKKEAEVKSRMFKSKSQSPHEKKVVKSIELEAIVDLKVLMMYTKQAATAAGGETNMLSLISLEIGNYNIALQNSLVDITVSYVAERIQEYDTYIEDNGADPFGTMLNQMGTTISTSRRNFLNCHAVHLITSKTQYCGLGWYSFDGLTNGNSVSWYSCIGGYMTTAHEVGHNIGLEHDLSVSPGTALNHGYCWDNSASTTACYRTIMAYSSCKTPSGRTNCQVAKYFSNPSVTNSGNAVGNAQCNNAQQLRNNINNFMNQFTPNFTSGVTLTPTSAPTLVNSKFENGLTSWTSTGTTASVSTGCWSGSCARLGSTTATNGDSTLSQSFVPGAGQTKLQIFFSMSCPDVVTNDWATVRVTDNTAGVSTSMSNQCLASGWYVTTFDLIPGRSYTVTLINHDDNNAANPTYTLFDELILMPSPTVSPSKIPSISPIASTATLTPSYSKTPSSKPTTSPSNVPIIYPTIIPTSAISLLNPGFENGLTSWTSTGTRASVSTGCWSGSCVRLGGTTATNGDSTLSQSFIPVAGQTKLQIFFSMSCPDVVTNDWAAVRVTDNTAGVSTSMSNQCLASGWYVTTFDLIPGRSYTVTLINHDDNNAANPTYTLFDELILMPSPTVSPSKIPSISPIASTATLTPSYSKTPSSKPTTSPSNVPIIYPTIIPTAAIPLLNPGFENGLTSWTSTGTTASVSTGCWSGSCARLGSTTATNGDSTLSQSFVPGAGQTKLQIFFSMSCPDVVTNDWATVRVTDNTAGVSTSMSNQCLASGWYVTTFDLIPGRSYTVTLINHDDNNAANPTYTLFDELILMPSPTVSPSKIPSISPIASTATLTPSYSKTPSSKPTTSPSNVPIIYPTIIPTAAIPLLNPGFENGLTSWTSTGTTASVSTGCWSGSCVRLGGTTATNGDSTLSQSFIPAFGQTQLKIYFSMSCPDVVANDWATIRVTDTATGSYSYMTNDCLPSGWYTITFDLIPGRSYTVTLINHDNNNALTPTYTLFDQLTLISVSSSSPSIGPTLTPISRSPSFNPTIIPSVYPSCNPTRIPSVSPTFNPTRIPSVPPTFNPTRIPSVSPSFNPTRIPSVSPSFNPTRIPSVSPSFNPTIFPSVSPSFNPTRIPSVSPNFNPTIVPSVSPTSIPTTVPSLTPSVTATSFSPSFNPIFDSSVSPSFDPTIASSVYPSLNPTFFPSVGPSAAPSTSSSSMSVVPTIQSNTASPTIDPTSSSPVTAIPSTLKPVQILSINSKTPSQSPTVVPSTTPIIPTATPILPTVVPSTTPIIPTATPILPTVVPSTTPIIPTATPLLPTVVPSTTPIIPTATPILPTVVPSTTPIIPTATPILPTVVPSTTPIIPTANPTRPTILPSSPTMAPTRAPTRPTVIPSKAPISKAPTKAPIAPTKVPTKAPVTKAPTKAPIAPTKVPTKAPVTKAPTRAPTRPTVVPTRVPTSPTVTPSTLPTKNPSGLAAVGISSENAVERNSIDHSVTLPVIIVFLSIFLILCTLAGLYCYFKKKKVKTIENIPIDEFYSTKSHIIIPSEDNPQHRSRTG